MTYEKDSLAQWCSMPTVDKAANLKQTISQLDSQDIRIMFGEMSSEEMRTVKAVLNWVKGQL